MLFPTSVIWNSSIPSKVGFFTWEVSQDKVLTLDHLKRKGWSLANRCFICLEKEDTIDHILVQCVKTRVLWNLLFSLFSMLWILPSSIRDTLLGRHGSFVGKRRKKV